MTPSNASTGMSKAAKGKAMQTTTTIVEEMKKESQKASAREKVTARENVA